MFNRLFFSPFTSKGGNVWWNVQKLPYRLWWWNQPEAFQPLRKHSMPSCRVPWLYLQNWARDPCERVRTPCNWRRWTRRLRPGEQPPECAAPCLRNRGQRVQQQESKTLRCETGEASDVSSAVKNKHQPTEYYHIPNVLNNFRDVTTLIKFFSKNKSAIRPKVKQRPAIVRYGRVDRRPLFCMLNPMTASK